MALLGLFPTGGRRPLTTSPKDERPRAPFFTTLRSRAILLAALAALPPVVVMLSMAIQWRRHEVLDAQAGALDLARRASAIHERELRACDRALAALETFVASLPAHEATAGAALDVVMAQVRNDNLGFYTSDGRLLAGAPSTMRDDAVRRPFFARAVTTGRMAVDDYAIDLEKRSAVLAMAYPVRNASGRTDRVILREFDVGWLRDLASEMSLPAGTLLAILDKDGTVLARHPRAAAGTPAVGHPALVAAAVRTNREAILEATAFDGVRRTFAIAPLRDSDTARTLFVGVGIPTATATALADRTLFVDFIGFSAASILVMFVASAAGERLVVRHVRALVAVADRLARGDLTARAGSAGRPAELAHLAAAFDAMADTIEARQSEVVRQRDHAALQEARTRAILENSQEGVSLCDSTGRWLYVSPAMARLLGRSPEDLLGRHMTDFAHGNDRQAMHVHLEQVLSRPGCVVSGCFRLREPDGGWRWIACDVQNLLHDPAIVALVVTCRDITDYRHTQEALREMRDDLDLRVRQRTAALAKANEALKDEIAMRKQTQESLQMLFHVVEQTADSVFVTNRDAVIEYVNPAFEVMTGYSREEAVGQTPRLFSSGRHDAQYFGALWTTITAGSVFRTIVTNKTKDGRLFDEDQTISPMRDEHGTITHFISTGRDITERKRTDQAVRRLNHQLEQETTRIANLLHDEAGQFLSSAHITLADLGRAVPPASRDQVEQVRRHLDQVEERLRTLSHDLHPRILTDMGLPNALRFRAELFARRTGIKADVETTVDRELSAAVQTALYRFVQEALTNAGKYAGATRVTITLVEAGKAVACTVRDDGRGFNLAEVVTPPGVPGLGIQNMRDRIEALGGTLEIVSNPRGGTLLRAVIPLED